MISLLNPRGQKLRDTLSTSSCMEAAPGTSSLPVILHDRKLTPFPFKESGILTLGVQTLLENPTVMDVHGRYVSQRKKFLARS